MKAHIKDFYSIDACDRLQAKKDDDEGKFSPEVTCDMPCSVPSTPNQPHLRGKTKTSFTIKWTVSICN